MEDDLVTVSSQCRVHPGMSRLVSEAVGVLVSYSINVASENNNKRRDN